VTVEAIEGRRAGEDVPDALVAVVDATNLRMNLRLVLELRRLGRPMIVALNMADAARAQGLVIDAEALSRELGSPVVETVAMRRNGHAALLAQIETLADAAATPPADHGSARSTSELQHEVRRLLAIAAPDAPRVQRMGHRVDAVLLHPVAELAMLLFLVFQAVFSWANLPMDAIKSGMAALGDAVIAAMDDGPLRSLLVDGVIAGTGGVLVFLPQILILFFFILLLEDSGYLPRAAFLLDTLMGMVGLSGRAFIPLLSSFACAVPGVMAARTIANPRDRLAPIMIAPLMTCSARLPVYALLIGAFVPDRDIGPFELRGLTLFGLCVAGVLSACAVAWCIKRFWTRRSYQPLMLELPPYRRPSLRSLALGLWERTVIFLRRVGTIIFSLMVVLWFLATFPAPPDGATGPAIQYSLAGMLRRALEVLFAPIGFNWQISISLVPGQAARASRPPAMRWPTRSRR
jgi:ferrous iron transport protein B